MKRVVLFVFVCFWLFGCHDSEDVREASVVRMGEVGSGDAVDSLGEVGADSVVEYSDGDADSDSDGDTDADTDADTDTDVDTDTDADTDTGSDTDTGANTNADTGVDSDTDTGADMEGDTDTAVVHGADTNVDDDTVVIDDSETATMIDSATETVAEMDTTSVAIVDSETIGTDGTDSEAVTTGDVDTGTGTDECSGVDELEGIWCDPETGLRWESLVGDEIRTYFSAREYCEGLEISGIDGWRLPDYFAELVTLKMDAIQSTCYWREEVFGVECENGFWSYVDIEDGEQYDQDCVAFSRIVNFSNQTNPIASVCAGTVAYKMAVICVHD